MLSGPPEQCWRHHCHCHWSASCCQQSWLQSAYHACLANNLLQLVSAVTKGWKELSSAARRALEAQENPGVTGRQEAEGSKISGARKSKTCNYP